jgi:hypothetical protein
MTATTTAPASHGPATAAEVLGTSANAQSVTAAPEPARDALGRAFDAVKFAADEAGNPKKDSKGRFYSRNLGKRPAEPAPDLSDIDRAAKGQAPEAPAGSAPAAAGSPDRFDLLADVYTRAAVAGTLALFSDEWAPDDAAEFIGLRNAAAAYLRATQRDDLPPGWALGFACLTYAGKRLPRPKTQSRLAYYRAILSAWWRGRQHSRAVAAMPTPGGAA